MYGDAWVCLNPRFDGAFFTPTAPATLTTTASLNPRFDGAFLNFTADGYAQATQRLNPRFDGAFLNFRLRVRMAGVEMT